MSIAHIVIQSVAWESHKQNRKLFVRLSKTALVFAITNRASPLYSQNKTDKNSNRNSVRVLAWWLRAMHASGKFESSICHPEGTKRT